MNTRVTAIGLLLALASVAPAHAQLARTNAIWARSTAGAVITLDGVLNEPAWAAAETWTVRYRYDNGVPGSGWKDEGGFPPNGTTSDSTKALLRFLVTGNQLFLGATVPDKSIGGGGGFNYFDGFLMGIKDHLASGFPKGIAEYLYSWWYPRDASTVSPCGALVDSARGNPPIFKGRWAPDPVCDGTGHPAPRTAEQIDAWNAATVVNGITNSDTTLDVGYTVEMRFDLEVMGYDATQSEGDIVEWNISIYDTDQYWKTPLTFDLSRNRSWWQNPWGRDMFHDEVRIYARPDVTVNSGALPPIPPDFTVPEAAAQAAPVIDGLLADAFWTGAPSFDIRWDDDPLRSTYPSVGKWRSGQFQPNVNGGTAFVTDGGDATVKYRYKGDLLYLGFDVRDKYVQSYTLEDRWDGFNVSITHRTERDPEDHNLQGKALAFRVNGTNGSTTATALAQKDLVPLLGVNGTNVALALKPATMLDTSGVSVDNGYTAELAVNLTQLGLPIGLGDKTIFLGITLYDGDSFNNPITDSYATRTWWFREREEACCPAWTLLVPGNVAVGDPFAPGAGGLAAVGNSPNPFRQATTLEFALAREADVSIEVYDVSGRLVLQRALGRFEAGSQKVPLFLPDGRSGLYLYRLRAQNRETGAVMATLSGKMMRLR